MKIVIVNDYARIVGGAAKIAILSAVAFADRGYDVEFFASVGPVAPELEAHPRIHVTCLDGVAHNRDPHRLRGAWNGLWDRRAAKALGNLLATCERSATIVHFHAYRDALTASVAHVAIKMGFVTMYTAHEYTLGCPYGGFFDYRRNAICPLRGLSGACLKTKCNVSGYGNKLWYYLGEFIFARIARIPQRLSHVVFISKLNRRVLLPYLGPKVRESIVMNLSDSVFSNPEAIGEASPFVFVGSLVAHKDPLTAARAARQLNAPIVFVGDGPLQDEIGREYPEAVVTGWVSSEEVHRRLRSARALIFPSIWYEAHPGVTMEAAASARGIIAADASAAVEQVEQLGAGAIFPVGDVQALTEAMRPYLNDKFAQSEGEKTREGYLKLGYTTDRYVAALVRIYEDELKRRA